MGIIYMFTSPENKSYIGQTIQSFDDRKRAHVNLAKKLKPDETSGFMKAIQEFGIINFKEELLISCPDIKLNHYEQKYIALYQTLSPNGYNLTKGGSGGGRFSEETKEKLSKIHKEKYQNVLAEREHIRQNGFLLKINKDIPNYMSEIKNKKKELAGYVVRGHPNCKLVKKFCNKANLKDAYDKAFEYLTYLENLDVPIENPIRNLVGNPRKTNLPKYVVEVKNKQKEVIGYAVNAHQFKEKRMEFTFKNKTLEEKLNLAIEYLNSFNLS